MKEKQESPRCRSLLILIDKIPNVMKLTFLLLVVSLLSFTATASAQRVSITLENAKVEKVLAAITNQTGLSVAYSKQIVDLNRRVSVNFTDAELPLVLDKLTGGTSLSYEVKNGKIYLFEKPLSNAITQQVKKITGVVVDSKGEPIIGANVVEKGTTNGTITDFDGKFTLEVSEKATLQISYIGFMSMTTAVEGRTSLTIRLKEDTQALDEVVVVGYGTQKKVNLTGAVSSVKYDDELANRPITNASQALSGKVSGVWISQNSGKPGDDGAQLRIRGWGTLNNSDPLVIVDGVEGDFGQINPNDIESISVLKDAASAAIYGSKAANGVILITTKMGKTNEKTNIELNSYVGLQQLGRRFNLITNSAEHMTMANRALINGGSKPVFPEKLISDFENGTDPYKYPNTDWYDYLYRNALISGHNLSIRGGSKNLSAFVSLNYLKQEGIIQNTDAQRYGIRANVEYKVRPWLRVGTRLSYARKDANEPFDIKRMFEMQTGATPFSAAYTRDGRYGASEAFDEEGVALYTTYNPVVDAMNGFKKTTRDYMSLNAFAKVDFTKHLNLQVNWSADGRWTMTDSHNQNIYSYTDSGTEILPKNLNREGIMMTRDQVSSMRHNFQAVLNYNRKFAGKHNLGAMAGMQLENYNHKNVYAKRSNPPKENLTQVDSGTDGIVGNGNMTDLRMFSYFGRVNYAYADKYLFEMNLRADASSRFKRGNRWGVFPGFSAGWRLNEESFIKDLDLFSNLKLRASWGQLGNQSIGGYWPYLMVFQQNYDLSYSYGGQLSPGAAITALVDENITWETTSSMDVGIDFGFFNNKLMIETDYFNKITKDIIVQLPIPKIMGDKTPPYENLGVMKNKGIELVINYDNQVMDRDKLGFSVGFNFTYIDNKVTKFQGGNSPDQLYLIRENVPYKALYGYKAVGVYQTKEEALEHMRNNGYKPDMGNLKYEDVNNDGKLDYQDKQVLGNTIPKITYGLTAGFRYKGFDLNMVFQGLGQTNIMQKSGFTNMKMEWMTISETWRDAWSPENPNSKIPMLRFDNAWDQYDSSYWIHRNDFLKLKNLQLGYLIPEHITQKVGVSKLYLYANASNLFTIMWKKGYEGYDPERDSFGAGAGFYPSPKMFTFGLNLNF